MGPNSGRETRIGLALGGGFARGIAHAGVLRVFEREGIPIHAISGVSSGAIAAAAFASGCSSREIEQAAHSIEISSIEGLGAFVMALLKKVKVWARQGVCCRSEAEGGVRIQSQYHLPFERQCHQVTPHTNQSAATIHGTGGTAS